MLCFIFMAVVYIDTIISIILSIPCCCSAKILEEQWINLTSNQEATEELWSTLFKWTSVVNSLLDFFFLKSYPPLFFLYRSSCWAGWSVSGEMCSDFVLQGGLLLHNQSVTAFNCFAFLPPACPSPCKRVSGADRTTTSGCHYCRSVTSKWTSGQKPRAGVSSCSCTFRFLINSKVAHITHDTGNIHVLPDIWTTSWTLV